MFVYNEGASALQYDPLCSQYPLENGQKRPTRQMGEEGWCLSSSRLRTGGLGTGIAHECGKATAPGDIVRRGAFIRQNHRYEAA